MRALRYVLAGCVVALLAAQAVVYSNSNVSLPPVRVDAPPPVHAETTEDASFQPLHPISNMPLKTVTDANLPEDELVIGVLIEGQARAYAAKYLEFPDHVYNDTIGATSFSVTHCEVTSCTRVFERKKNQILKTAGWSGYEMMLKLDGEYWGHSAEGIPLQDLEFEKTTWAVWRSRHPNTLVYTGEGGTRRKWFGDGPIPVDPNMIEGARLFKEKRGG